MQLKYKLKHTSSSTLLTKITLSLSLSASLYILEFSNSILILFTSLIINVLIVPILQAFVALARDRSALRNDV